MAISAKAVKELRDMTGVGMMKCKEALVACDGDMDKAVDWLREKGLAAQAKKASKVASEGVSIIFISSDLPEIINMSSRVVVMHEGKIAKVLDGAEEEFTQTKIMRYATGQGD